MITRSEKETISFAKKFAASVKDGAVLGLVGELGAGKTQFVKGIAKGLKIDAPITSPTFVVAKNYDINKDGKLIHIDCYRLSTTEEMEDIGFLEFIENKNNVVVVEWADNIKSIMPDGTIWINFKTGKKDNERIIELPSR